jgi:hypothetical protein
MFLSDSGELLEFQTSTHVWLSALAVTMTGERRP